MIPPRKTLPPRQKNRRLRALVCLTAVLALASLACSGLGRKLLYQPTHHSGNSGLTPWIANHSQVGFAREVRDPQSVWLLAHGNAGQAADRLYALAAFAPNDSVFILEYPGYGSRPGTPSLESFNAAAAAAYQDLRRRFPTIPVCVVGESIGTGPAAALALAPRPPDKMVLIVPFDVLSRVANHHFPYLPTRLLLADNWNNLQSLATYHGPLEIIAAGNDQVIPIAHARALAASKPHCRFREIPGGHNDWSADPSVKIRYP